MNVLEVRSLPSRKNAWQKSQHSYSTFHARIKFKTETTKTFVRTRIKMSVESYLTRELSIRFIDARSFVTEAKVSLGINGYPDKSQLALLREESIRLFLQSPEGTKRKLQRLNADLQAVKLPSETSETQWSEYSDYHSARPTSTDDTSTRSQRRTLGRLFLRR